MEQNSLPPSWLETKESKEADEVLQSLQGHAVSPEDPLGLLLNSHSFLMVPLWASGDYSRPKVIVLPTPACSSCSPVS